MTFTDVWCRFEISSCFATQVKDQNDQKIVDPSNVDRSNIENIEAGNLSNENAERRADAGSNQPFSSVQAFDGVGKALSFFVYATNTLLIMAMSHLLV
jgi:hypothetical protein